MTPKEALNVLSQVFVDKGGLSFTDILLAAQAIEVLRELVMREPEPPKADDGNGVSA